MAAAENADISRRTLAGYIFGPGNVAGDKMEMTTPVLTGGGRMQFPLSGAAAKDASLAPPPLPGSNVAVSTDPGCAMIVI